jgi:putative DNA primase/helicase
MNAAPPVPANVEQFTRALQLHRERGWSLIPIDTDKKPLVKWKSHQAEGVDWINIMEWYGKLEPPCWAAVTGAISSLVVLDFDGEEGRQTLESLGFEPHVTTPSGGAHVHLRHPGEGVHVVTRAPLDAERWPAMDCRGDGGYAIVCGPGYVWHDSEPLPWSALPEDLARELLRPDAPTVRTPRSSGRVQEGGRHNHLLSVAGRLTAAGVRGAALEAAIVAENEDSCDPPMPEKEVRDLATDVIKRYGAVAGRAYQLTDLGNAERLADLSGGELRYVVGIGWLVWDGRRWRRDEGDIEVKRRGAAAARSQYVALADGGDDERSARRRWAAYSESRRGIESAVNLAAMLPAITISPSELDADLWLMNVSNGTINLRTGTLRPHDRDDLLTKLAPVHYERDARSDRWESFIRRATGDDRELLACVQRLGGYTLTGSTAEQKLVFVHGPGATGKTTYARAMQGALGDYAMTADFETFLVRRGDGGVRNDIARLAGARMVISIEVDDGKQLAEGLVKTITGGDRVTARFLYREAFEFVPQFTLWLVANARPRVRAEDDALWRRILQIPFIVVIPPEERDPELQQALCTDPTEQTAILAWLVQGCLDWQREGLAVPARVHDYTAEYKSENDPLGQWLAECCVLDAAGEVRAGDLGQSLESWWGWNADGPAPSKIALAKRLKALGCISDPRRDARYWRGIRLRDACDACDGTSGNSPYARAYGEVSDSASHPVTDVTGAQIPPSSPTNGRPTDATQ